MDKLKQAEEAIKAAYRKHVLADPAIGWDELADILCNTLCELLGDEGFQEFLRQQDQRLIAKTYAKE